MSAVTKPTPLPEAIEIRELFEGLLGREVEAKIGTGAVDPYAHPGGMVAVYVDDHLTMRAIIVVDLALAAYLGTSIALIPAATAKAALEDGVLPASMGENAYEVLNIAASLFNHDDAPHVRLYKTYAPKETLPADVRQAVLSYGTRLDMEATVVGYGTGRLSVLVV